MDVSEFIRSALVDIATGVHLAAVETRNIVAIAPGKLNQKAVELSRDVSFDIAVTVASETGDNLKGNAEVGTKLKVVAFEAGISGKGEISKSNNSRYEHVSRIQFAVPITFNAHFRADPNAQQNAAETLAKIQEIKSGTSMPEGISVKLG